MDPPLVSRMSKAVSFAAELSPIKCIPTVRQFFTDVSPTCPLFFSGGSAKFDLMFRRQSLLSHPRFELKQDIRNLDKLT